MRVLIADGDRDFRQQVLRLVAETFNTREIVEVSGFPALLTGLEIKPELLIVARDLEGFDLARDVETLRSALPATPIIVVTRKNARGEPGRAETGSWAPLLIHLTRAELFRASLQALVRSGSDAAANVTAGPVTDATVPTELKKLSIRQCDVLRGLCKGQSNKEIARDLNLSPFTVRVHVTAIFNTLDVHSRTAAASFALSNGFIRVD